ncbi:hypothetical protein DV735_g506, partial [Chaetothyriales sp. CBS 134920]
MELTAPIPTEFVHVDGSKVTDKIIGIGGTNIVVEQGIYAVKLPRLSRFFAPDGVSVLIDQSRPPGKGGYDYRGQLINALENEKAIYRRLGPHDGITPCFNPSSTEPSVQLLRMGQSLRSYLGDANDSNNNRPERKRQLAWAIQLAETLAHIHSRGVIVGDISPSNILLEREDEASSGVRFVDFSESSLMAPDWDRQSPDAYGYSVLSDIAQLGAVIFLLVTGRPCKFSLEEDAQDPSGPLAWPRRDSLPETDGVWLGDLVDKCWTKGFASADGLAAALRQVEVQWNKNSSFY